MGVCDKLLGKTLQRCAIIHVKAMNDYVCDFQLATRYILAFHKHCIAEILSDRVASYVTVHVG